MDPHRLQQQITFILEIDKLKSVLRQSYITVDERHENSAEHSWHLATMALILNEHAEEKIDLCHVLKLLLVHDIIEIDAGDTYCHDDQGKADQSEREKLAADRIFNILPPDQARTFRDLWEEFEESKTPESRFANALDRMLPHLHNYFTRGQTWQENDIKKDQVKSQMRPVNDGAPVLWNYVNSLIDDAVKKGFLAE